MNTYSKKVRRVLSVLGIVWGASISYALAQSFQTNVQAIPSLGSTTQSTTTIQTNATTSTLLPDYRNRQVVEARVRSYFADIPVMIAIADCESKFRQFDSTGAPLNGGAGGMIGVFQIYSDVHSAFALSKGFDITTVDGNLGYARYLYENEGTNPWISSFPCWGLTTSNPESALRNSPQAITTPQVTRNDSSVIALTATLSFGMTHPQVAILQQVLNSTGFLIATNGPGSRGNETMKFGSLTRDSVRRFQCEKGIVCSGDEASTGYGYVGARTRQALNIAIQGGTSNNTATQPASSTQSLDDKARRIKDLEGRLQEQMKIVNDIQAEIVRLKTN